MAMPIPAAPLELQQDWDVPEQVGLWEDVWRRFRRVAPVDEVARIERANEGVISAAR